MELGAKVVWLSGENVAHELQRFAEGHGVTLAIFGKSRRPFWSRLVRGSPIDAFTGAGSGVDVYEMEPNQPV